MSERRLVTPALVPFHHICPPTLPADPGPEQEEIEMLRQQLAKASLEANDSTGGAGVSTAPNTANENAPQPLSGGLVSEERSTSCRTWCQRVHRRLQRHSVPPRMNWASIISSALAEPSTPQRKMPLTPYQV